MEELTVSDYVAILRRWKKVFFVVTLVLSLAVIKFTLDWANYRSTATIQVEQPEISASATTPQGMNPQDHKEALADQRISAIQQKVLSTASLIEVATKFNLYPSERESLPIANIIEKRMLKDIKVDLLSSALANPSSASRGALSAIAFTLSFDYDTPLLAQQVADELASRFLDQDLKERRTAAQQTSAFLGAQIQALEASLSEQERKIAEYQSKHGISRPETLAFNQQLVASLTLNLQNLDSQIATQVGNLGALRGQLASLDPYSRVISDGQVMTSPSIQLKALQAQYSTLTAQYGPEHPDVVKLRHQIESLRGQVKRPQKDTSNLKAQITDLQTNLAAAEKTYGPDHPDVVSLRKQLERTEDRLASQRGSSADDFGTVSDADNPAYLQVVSQIRSAEEQRKSLQNQRKEVQSQLESYQRALIENPQAQKEMAAITRDYENAQMRYRELREKKMAADMDEQMQKERTGERFILINPPELPVHTQPRRLFLLLGGLVMSAFGGLVGVAVAQLVKQSIVGIHYLESIVGVTPLVVIPHITTREERHRTMIHRLILGLNGFFTFLSEQKPPNRIKETKYYERLMPLYKRILSACKRFTQSRL